MCAQMNSDAGSRGVGNQKGNQKGIWKAGPATRWRPALLLNEQVLATMHTVRHSAWRVWEPGAAHLALPHPRRKH